MALLAGVGTGIYSSVPEACAKTIQVVDRVKPNASNARVYEKYYPIFTRLYGHLKDEFTAVAQVYEELQHN